MKILNKTEYNTKDLKRIFIACCRTKLDTWKYLKVEVSYSKKSRWITGFGRPDWIEISLPRNPMDKKYIDERFGHSVYYAYLNFKRMLAWVFIHELHHHLGRYHRAMRGSYYNKWNSFAREPERVAWVDIYELRKKESKVQSSSTLRLKRYEHVIAMLEKKKKLLKRLQRQIKKWTTKKRYYEGAFASKSKIKKGRNLK